MGICEGESDKGAAVLAGGFVEYMLGNYLRVRSTIAETADELFSPMGLLASFSQRIAVAYAFGFINKQHYEDLNIVPRVRNEFAHQPVDTTFQTEKIAVRVAKLSTFDFAGTSDPKTQRERNRLAYLFACAMFSAGADQHIRRQGKRAGSTSATKPSS